MAWLARGFVRATTLMIAAHGTSILLFGDAAWRGFWFGLPALLEGIAEVGLGAAMLHPRGRPWVAFMAAVAGLDAVRYFRLDLFAAPPLPLSLGLAMLLAWRAWRPPSRPRWLDVPAIGLGLGAIPFLWIFSFGLTDYRRPCDAVVVFGAKADSLPLIDRTRTALELPAGTLVLSGGPGEPESMAQMIGGDRDVVMDVSGVNTRATARRLAELARERGWRRVMAVSHYYHLPRVKLACLQEGVNVRTVPCRMSPQTPRQRYNIARECAGFYVYLLRLDTLRD